MQLELFENRLTEEEANELSLVSLNSLAEDEDTVFFKGIKDFEGLKILKNYMSGKNLEDLDIRITSVYNADRDIFVNRI